MTPLPWTPMRRLLERLMSDISEECWCASWDVSTDVSLWALLEGESKSKVWHISTDEAEQLRALSQMTGSWITWPKGSSDNIAVSLDEWRSYYASWNAA